MSISILGLLGIIFGFMVRKGKVLEIKMKIFEKQEDVNKWVSINIILAGIVFILYGLMNVYNKTTLVSHIMLVIILIFFMIRIKIGPSKNSNKEKESHQ